MRKLLVIALAALVAIQVAHAAAHQGSFIRRPTAGGGLASFSDNFDGADNDAITNWTPELEGDADRVSNVLSFQTTTYTRISLAYTGGTCTTVNQYQKVTAAVSGAQYFGFIFRFTNTGAGFYRVWGYYDEDEIHITYYSSLADFSGTDIQTITGATLTGSETLGATCVGTGNSTVWNVWVNPSANAPTATGTLWDGAAPTYSATNNPGTAVDTGASLGMSVEQAAAGNVTANNWFGGDCP